MQLRQLELQCFRNYERAELEFPSGLIWIAGPNASGKSNLLEAIHLVCNGGSHRTPRDRELITWGCERYRVRGRLVVEGVRHEVTVAYDPAAGKGVQLDGTPLARRSDLLRVAGVVIFTPDDLQLIKGPPGGRRRLLDRLAVYQDRRHAADLQELNALLEQRNQLLRQLRSRYVDPAMAELFDQQFLDCAARIRARRVRTVAALLPLLQGNLRGLGGSEDVDLRYLEDGQEPHPALDTQGSQEFWHRRGQRRLAQVREEERQRGQTLWGPQRDDVRLQLDGRDARAYASQGQQRALVLALKQAELVLLERAIGSPPLLLLDDVLSELDAERGSALLRLAGEREQAFLTATDVVSAPAGAPRPSTVLRVRAGRVEVVGP